MAYIGEHFQNSPNRWPDAVSKLKDGTIIKFLFGVERCREAKGINPNLKTWYRWVGDQPLPHDNFEQHCRDWLNQFIDGTFRREAEHVDYIQGYNETLANSQGPDERARWVALHTAMAKVWHDEYRQEEALSHIRIILCETAIGNDIPLEIATAAQKYDAILGYHPYIVCRVGKVNLRKAAVLDGLGDDINVRYDAPRAEFHDWSNYRDPHTRLVAALDGAIYDEPLYKMNESIERSFMGLLKADAVADAINVPDYVSPHDWRWYSGRWATMDAEFVARGIHVDLAFGEGGPVLDASEDWSGWLDPLGGWRNPDCLNGDLNKYKAVMDYWLQNTFQTPAYKEGRVLGVQLFTSGAPGGSDGQWGNFDLIGDDMQQIAEFSGAYDYPPTGETPMENWQQEVWDKSIELQTISLNPKAALQAAIFSDDFVPVESEFWHTIDDIQYAAQAAEHLETGARRVYYTTVPEWDNVRWFLDPSAPPF